MSGFLAPIPSLVESPIINGDFNIWQRGTTFAAMAVNTFLADRFFYSKSGTMVHTGSRTTNAPTSAGRLFNYSLDLDCTTNDAAIAAGDYCALYHRVEGFNFLPFAQRKFFLSFWVYATKTGTYCVAFCNAGADRTFVGEYTVAASNTWQLVTIPVSASPSSGTWNYVNGLGLDIRFALAGGSTYQTSVGAWNTGNFLCTANQVNACDTIGNKFRITGLRLSVVPYPLAYAPTRTFGEEISLCQRYFEKGGFGADVAPAAGVSNIMYPSMTWAANNTSCQVSLMQQKRAAPTITIYGGASGGSGNLAGVLVGGSFATVASNAAERIETTSFGLYSTYVGLAYGDSYGFNFGWTASAEL